MLTDLPDFRFTQLALGHALVGQRDWQGAVEAYEDCLRQLGPAIAGGPLVFALARSGRLEEARTRMAELEQVAADGYVPPSKLAIAHLGLGARNRALAELGRAVDEHDDRLVYLAVDPLYRELHGDPAFRDILARVGLERVLDAP